MRRKSTKSRGARITKTRRTRSRNDSGGLPRSLTRRKRGASSRRRSPASEGEAQPILLYSTAKPFSWYIANCEEFAPHLLQRGIFNQLFMKWPPFGCSLYGYVPKELRDQKFDRSGLAGIFLGWDKEISGGVRLGQLKECFELQKRPLSDVITVTAGKFQQEEQQ